MKKSDLKTGMRVETNKGNIYLVIKDIECKLYGHQDLAFVNKNGFLIGSNYDESLKNINGDNEFDIKRIFAITFFDKHFLQKSLLNLDKRYAIWEREEPKKMTDSEIEKELGYQIEIVAEEIN